MSWSFYCDPKCGRDFIINKIKSPGYLSDGYLMIMVMPRGNKIWYLFQTPEGKKTIGLTLIKSGGSGSGYGEKRLSESMGPSYYDCPLSLLEKADEAPDEWAEIWREDVRRYHAEKKALGGCGPGKKRAD